MNGTNWQPTATNHDEIARLACQLWQKEGCQSGRDNEYWLRAERHLRAVSQHENAPSVSASKTRKDSASMAKK